MPLSKKNSSQLRSLRTNGNFCFHLANQRTGYLQRMEKCKRLIQKTKCRTKKFNFVCIMYLTMDLYRTSSLL